MKNISLKIAALILTTLVLVLLLTACGGKTNAKAPKTDKVKKAQPVARSGVNSTHNQTEQVKFTSELSATSVEMNSAIQEIDAVLSDIDRIDISQDNVPNL